MQLFGIIAPVLGRPQIVQDCVLRTRETLAVYLVPSTSTLNKKFLEFYTSLRGGSY